MSGQIPVIIKEDLTTVSTTQRYMLGQIYEDVTANREIKAFRYFKLRAGGPAIAPKEVLTSDVVNTKKPYEVKKSAAVLNRKVRGIPEIPVPLDASNDQFFFAVVEGQVTILGDAGIVAEDPLVNSGTNAGNIAVHPTGGAASLSEPIVALSNVTAGEVEAYVNLR